MKKLVFFADKTEENHYICIMKKVQKNIVLTTSLPPTERKIILESLVASFRIEGINIPDTRVQAIYARVNEKLKKWS